MTSAGPATAQVFGSDDNFVIAAVGDRFNPKALDEVRVALRLSCRADFPRMLRGGNIDPDIAHHLPDAGYLLANFVRDTADVQTLEALHKKTNALVAQLMPAWHRVRGRVTVIS